MTDRQRFRSFATSVALIAEARRQAPRHFKWRPPPYEFEKKKLPIDLLAGGDGIRRAIERGAPLARIERSWRPALLAVRPGPANRTCSTPEMSALA